jgi:uncharacterized membrane protein
MSSRRLAVAGAALALVGAGISAYLAYAHYRGIAPVCSTAGCQTVERSRYASVASIPVSVLGLAAYAALLACAAARGAGVRATAAALALGGLAFSGYLLLVSLFTLHAVCQWCLANDVVIALLALVAVLRLRAPTGAAAEPRRCWIGRRTRQADSPGVSGPHVARLSRDQGVPRIPARARSIHGVGGVRRFDGAAAARRDGDSPGTALELPAEAQRSS